MCSSEPRAPNLELAVSWVSLPFIITVGTTVLLPMSCILYRVCTSDERRHQQGHPFSASASLVPTRPCWWEEQHAALGLQSWGASQRVSPAPSGGTDARTAKPAASMLRITRLTSALRRGVKSWRAQRVSWSSTSSVLCFFFVVVVWSTTGWLGNTGLQLAEPSVSTSHQQH